VAKQTHKLTERPGWSGYAVAIVVSALGHVGFLVFALLILPNWLHSDAAPPPAMTVKIVDNIPAGDLGTHLPKLHKPPAPEQVAKEEVKPDEPPPPEEKPPQPPKPDNDDKNAISLSSPVPTPTPIPPPPPAVIPATEVPTATPTPKKVAEPAPTPAPPPVVHHHDKVIVHNPPPKPKHTPVMMAKAEKTPDVHEQFRKLQAEMLKKRIEEAKKQAADDEDDSDDDDSDTESPPPANDTGGHGPVVSNANTAGSGYGVGSGTGSMGEIKDLQYLLYFRTVQQRVKDAWTFPGGSNELSADVEFSIGADGTLNGVKIAKSSGDSAFDDSVMRAIKRAAPFPPPPDRYRSQFSDVVSTFKLGELKS
jgi:TonB family protein